MRKLYSFNRRLQFRSVNGTEFQTIRRLSALAESRKRDCAGRKDGAFTLRNIALAALLVLLLVSATIARAADDFPLWSHYRTTVAHPASTLKAADIARARANVALYPWAKTYRDDTVAKCAAWLPKLTSEFIEHMIPATTPGAIEYTPCPACRDQKKPANPHGSWNWSPHDPDHLTCAVCGTVYPNEKYPETIVRTAHYGGIDQIFTYYGGKPFPIFAYKAGEPSFTGNIRGRKVEFMAGLARSCAEAYALTGDLPYADAARRILDRFAAVYPRYLVHSGYGEFADIDPDIAAKDVTTIPVAEILAVPQAKPEPGLHTGYWTAGRAQSTGMEAGFVRPVNDAYDLTCAALAPDGKPLYSESERRTIEKDLLLESTVLMTADPSVNNKSIGNSAAAGLVGMTVGDPELVRFGLKAFESTVNGWFLPDGGTPESWSYALQTIGGIQGLGDAFHGYSDPPGYKDSKGIRLQNLNPYEMPAYKRVWESMFNGLQGDLHYPPLADSHRRDGMSARLAELMVANYPENDSYRVLLIALAGNDLSHSDPIIAIYHREPGLEKKPAPPPLTLPDYVFPFLRIGYLRGGATGRDSTLILSASDWGAHHHRDSLNLDWWEGGAEQLSDLGYLRDNPNIRMTQRTFAHNTVLVDGVDQITTGRGGDFTLFSTGKLAKVMEAESRAYPQVDLYRRTVAQIEIPAQPGSTASRYIVDIFRVGGGTGKEFDYVFHGPNTSLQTAGLSLAGEAMAGSDSAPLDLTNIRHISAPAADGTGEIRLTWTTTPGREFTAQWPDEKGELSLLGDGWGQRDPKNTDAGATLPYIVRQRQAVSHSTTVFAGVLEAHPAGKRFVSRVTRLPLSSIAPYNPPGDVALKIETAIGIDYVISCQSGNLSVRLNDPNVPLEISGKFAVVHTVGGKPVSAFATKGTAVYWGGRPLPFAVEVGTDRLLSPSEGQIHRILIPRNHAHDSALRTPTP